MQAFPLREKGEQTVLADSYSIVLQPLIWISYGHSIRRFSLSRPKLRRRGCHRFPWKSPARVTPMLCQIAAPSYRVRLGLAGAKNRLADCRISRKQRRV